MNSIRDFVRENLNIPILGDLLDSAPDWVVLGVAGVLLFATIGSVVLLFTNAARGVQFVRLASCDPAGAIKRVANPSDHLQEIEALRTQLTQLEAKIDAMNRPWIRIPDFVCDAFDGLAGLASRLLSVGDFAELRKRMEEVLAKFPDSNWARRRWIDATQGLADTAAKHGQTLLAASQYREAIQQAEALLRKS